MTQQTVGEFHTIADMNRVATLPVLPGVGMADLVEKGGLAVQLYKFEPGAEAGPDYHADTEFGYVVNGEVYDGERTYGPGALWVAERGTTHYPSSTTGALVLIVLRKDRP